MQGQGSSGSSSQSSPTSGYDPQQIIGWSKTAKRDDLLEVGKSIFNRVGTLDPSDQKMFFDQLNRDPTVSKLLQQYTHA